MEATTTASIPDASSVKFTKNVNVFVQVFRKLSAFFVRPSVRPACLPVYLSVRFSDFSSSD